MTVTLIKATDKGMHALADSTPRMADPSAYEARREYRRKARAKNPSGAKRSTVSNRPHARAEYLVGRKVKQFAGPPAITDGIKDALASAALTYGALHKDATDPHSLTMSNYTATALKFALNHVHDWLATVPNNGRREHFRLLAEARAAGVPFETKPPRGLLDVVWPDAVANAVPAALDRYGDDYKTLRESPESITYELTASPLVLTAILWAITRENDWLATVPNDPRHSPLAPTDKRLDPAKWNGGNGPTRRTQ